MNNSSISKPRILIVDRNEDLRELFSYFLELRGFNVRTVSSGALALTCASEFAPHAVFSSLRIGELDGYMLAKELRKLPQTANATLVAMSAYSHERDHVYEAGFNNYLSKPIAFETLITIIAPLEAGMYSGSKV